MKNILSSIYQLTKTVFLITGWLITLCLAGPSNVPAQSDEKAVDPNPHGGDKYGVGDATIAKIEGDGEQETSLPVPMVRLKIGDTDHTIEVSSGTATVTFTVDLEESPDRIQTWLMDNHEKVLSSAYYTNVHLVQ